MSNRPASMSHQNNPDPPSSESIIMGLFSKTPAPSTCDASQSLIDSHLQNASDSIDAALLDMAAEGYVLPAAETEIPEVLKEIRRTGCLEAATSDDQPRLAIKCVILRPVSADNGKVWWCAEGKAQSAKVAPSSVWAGLGGAQYDFVDGRK